MSHPIIDGLLIGAAAGIAGNLANRAMQPGQTPIWTGNCPDGTILTVVTTRSNQFEMWAVYRLPGNPAEVARELGTTVTDAMAALFSASHSVLLGSWPNWVTLQMGLSDWANYLSQGPAAIQIMSWINYHNQARSRAAFEAESAEARRRVALADAKGEKR